jgi:DnaJ-like protein
MTGENAALKIALDLVRVPWRVRFLKAEKLPQGVALLLRIAAGDAEAEAAVVGMTDRRLESVHEAATFFIEQILLCPEADSYRVLGASQDADSVELRRNMALLTRWLHPDLDRHGERAVFVGRVTKAWNDLKTPERRAAYDERKRSQRVANSVNGDARRVRRRMQNDLRPWNAAGQFDASGRERQGFLRRALSFLLGGARY